MTKIRHSTKSKQYYVNMTAQLLKEMRGSISQGAINKKLAHRHNLISKWETGAIKIKWLDFVKFAKVCNKSLDASTKGAFLQDSASDVRGLVLAIMAERSASEFSNQIGISERTLKRWILRQQEPSAADIFMIMDQGTRFLFQFLQPLVDPMRIETLRQRATHQTRLDEFVSRCPQAVAMSCLIETPHYQSSKEKTSDYFGKYLGLKTTEINTCLLEMRKLGLVQRHGTKYIIPDSADANITMSFCAVRLMNQYWTEKLLGAFEALESSSPLFKAGNLVFTTSDVGYDLIKKKMVEFYNFVRTHAYEKDQANRVGVLLLYLADLHEVARLNSLVETSNRETL